MEQSLSCKANSHSASQETSYLLLSLKVHYHVQKSLSQINPVHTFPPHFSNVHFTIILPSKTRSSKWSFPSGFPTKPLYAFLIFPCVLHELPILSPSLNHLNNIGWRLQVMILFTIKFSPASCLLLLLLLLLPLRSKYSPQHFILKHPQSMNFPQCKRPNSTSTQNK